MLKENEQPSFKKFHYISTLFSVNQEGRKYVYGIPTQHGPNTYGMQPVLHASQYSAPLRHDEYIPPASLRSPPAVSYQPPTPDYTRKHGPPSSTSSVSGAYVSREIDL